MSTLGLNRPTLVRPTLPKTEYWKQTTNIATGSSTRNLESFTGSAHYDGDPVSSKNKITSVSLFTGTANNLVPYNPPSTFTYSYTDTLITFVNGTGSAVNSITIVITTTD
jgi:hypothetical protein